MNFIHFFYSIKKVFLVGAVLVFCTNASAQEAVSSSSAQYINRLQKKQDSLISMKDKFGAFDVSQWEKLAMKVAAKRHVRKKIEPFKAKKIRPQSKDYDIKNDSIPISPRSAFLKDK
jgi:hypothetical protein